MIDINKPKQCKMCKKTKLGVDFISSFKKMIKTRVCKECRNLIKQNQRKQIRHKQGEQYFTRTELKQLTIYRKEKKKKEKEKIKYENFRKTKLFQFLNEYHPDLIHKNVQQLKIENHDVYLEYYRFFTKKRYDASIIKHRNKTKFYKAINPHVYASKSNYFRMIDMASDHSITYKKLISILKHAVTCPFCNTLLNDNNKSLAHIDPISKGGLHSIKNIIVCCKVCNIRKRHLSFIEFINKLNYEKRKELFDWYKKKNYSGSFVH